MKMKKEMIFRAIRESEFGLEKESLRIDRNGKLADTDHPFAPDSPVQRDFSESQTEIVTGVWNSVKEVCDDLERLHEEAVCVLAERPEGREYLWPFSNPPHVKDESQIKIAQYMGEKSGLKKYREYLAEKYGKKKMLYCGIHFNFSLQDSLLQSMFEAYSQEGQSQNLKAFKNTLYLGLAERVVKYGWLLVYLMSASPSVERLQKGMSDPVPDDMYAVEELKAAERETSGEWKGEASPRCGENGYWNDFVPVLSYSDLEAYIQSIEAYIEAGKLRSAGELYYPVRIKPRGDNSLEGLRKYGINHIELRTLDLNPLSEYGILEQDLAFIHLFFLYLLQREDSLRLEGQQIEALKNMKAAAGFPDGHIIIYENGIPYHIEEAALALLEDMEKFYRQYQDYNDLSGILAYQKEKILHPEKRYAVCLAGKYGSENSVGKMRLAKQYTEEILQKKNLQRMKEPHFKCACF